MQRPTLPLHYDRRVKADATGDFGKAAAEMKRILLMKA
jgi:hypothetical protein